MPRQTICGEHQNTFLSRLTTLSATEIHQAQQSNNASVKPRDTSKMSIIATSFTKSLLPVARKKFVADAVCSMTVISKESREAHKGQDFSKRMKSKGLPLSPHVTIYSFPIAALTSITNRVTGCLLSFGAFGVGALDLFGGPGTTLSLCQYIGDGGILLTTSAKLSVAFPFIYHYLAAARHVAWDNYPELLSNDQALKHSQLLVGASIATSGVFIMI